MAALGEEGGEAVSEEAEVQEEAGGQEQERGACVWPPSPP